MSIVIWAILGFIAGTAAKFTYNQIFRAYQLVLGIPGTILLGILGAFVGGYLGQRFFGTGPIGSFSLNDPESLATAVIGAFSIIFVWGLLTRPSD